MARLAKPRLNALFEQVRLARPCSHGAPRRRETGGSFARPWVLAGLGFGLVLPALPALAVAVGDIAPNFRLPASRDPRSGASDVLLADLRGKLVYLDFWASWCGPCKQSFPWMNDMQLRYGKQGLTVLAVDVDIHSDDARAFLAELPPNFRVAFDPQGVTPRQYAIRGMPTSILIGPDGKVLLVRSGFRADEAAQVETGIRQALLHLSTDSSRAPSPGR